MSPLKSQSMFGLAVFGTYGFLKMFSAGSLLNEQQSPSSVKSLLKCSSQLTLSLCQKHDFTVSVQDWPT
jgi:hypothetical protein